MWSVCVQPINHNIIATQPEQNQPNCRKRGLHSRPVLLQYYCVQPWHRSKFLEPVPWTITLPNWNRWQTLLQSRNEGAQAGSKPKYKRMKIANVVDVIPTWSVCFQSITTLSSQPQPQPQPKCRKRGTTSRTGLSQSRVSRSQTQNMTFLEPRQTPRHRSQTLLHKVKKKNKQTKTTMWSMWSVCVQSINHNIIATQPQHQHQPNPDTKILT